MRQFNAPNDLARLRRIALAAQGLTKTKPFGSGKTGAIKAINHIGYVQLDTISVVERAHNHVLNSRIPNFKPEMTNQLLVNGDIFEYWSHAAALLPIADYRFSLPYKNAIKNGKTHWYKNPDKQMMAELLARVREEGPLRARDVECVASNKAGWWDWKPAKKALEQLYMQGDLMVNSRQGFQKSYDLKERVLPSHINTQMPTIEEFAEHLIEQQLRCQGLVSLEGITYLRRNAELRHAVKRRLDIQVSQGDLLQVQVPSNDIYLVKTNVLEQPMPRITDRLYILSPFDNCVIQRKRLKALFDFDYQIECYVPEAKRQYGYFTLPLLFRDQFIGRMDCKVHRSDKVLEIKSLHFEKHGCDTESLAQAFAESIQQFCSFQQSESVQFTNRQSQQFTQDLKPRLLDLNLECRH